MKHLKILSLLLLTALSATNVWAQFSYTVTVSTIKKGFSYNGNECQGLVYEDDSSLLGNEEMHVVVVEQVKSSASFKTPENLFKVDALGNILPTETLESIGTIKASSSFRANSDDTTFGTKNVTAPTVLLNASACNSVKVEFTANPTPSTRFHVYVFFFDSRYFLNNVTTFAIDETTTRANKWSVVYGGAVGMMPTAIDMMFIDRSFEDVIDLSSFTICDYVAPSIPTLLPQSLVDDEGNPLDLTPKMTEVAQIDDGFSLTGISPDVITYTLQTKTSLDGEWVDFDTVAEQILADVNEKLSTNDKKTLAKNFQTCYTYLRVKDSTKIEIPRSPKETQRFYRLKAE